MALSEVGVLLDRYAKLLSEYDEKCCILYAKSSTYSCGYQYGNYEDLAGVDIITSLTGLLRKADDECDRKNQDIEFADVFPIDKGFAFHLGRLGCPLDPTPVSYWNSSTSWAAELFRKHMRDTSSTSQQFLLLDEILEYLLWICVSEVAVKTPSNCHSSTLPMGHCPSGECGCHSSDVWQRVQTSRYYVPVAAHVPQDTMASIKDVQFEVVEQLLRVYMRLQQRRQQRRTVKMNAPLAAADRFASRWQQLGDFPVLLLVRAACHRTDSSRLCQLLMPLVGPVCPSMTSVCATYFNSNLAPPDRNAWYPDSIRRAVSLLEAVCNEGAFDVMYTFLTSGDTEEIQCVIDWIHGSLGACSSLIQVLPVRRFLEWMERVYPIPSEAIITSLPENWSFLSSSFERPRLPIDALVCHPAVSTLSSGEDFCGKLQYYNASQVTERQKTIDSLLAHLLQHRLWKHAAVVIGMGARLPIGEAPLSSGHVSEHAPPSVFQLVLDMKMDVNATLGKKSLLSSALCELNVEAVRFLLGAGADPNMIREIRAGETRHVTLNDYGSVSPCREPISTLQSLLYPMLYMAESKVEVKSHLQSLLDRESIYGHRAGDSESAVQRTARVKCVRLLLDANASLLGVPPSCVKRLSTWENSVQTMQTFDMLLSAETCEISAEARLIEDATGGVLPSVVIPLVQLYGGGRQPRLMLLNQVTKRRSEKSRNKKDAKHLFREHKDAWLERQKRDVAVGKEPIGFREFMDELGVGSSMHQRHLERLSNWPT